MCGIVGYIGTKNSSEVVLNGLSALEYRGYDSAGIAIAKDQDHIELLRTVGSVESLRTLVAENHIDHGNAAIGHTRWATHGTPTVENAHPHANADQTIFIVHNGIIENYQEIKTHLESKGYVFQSETDTEVIPHLIDYYVKEGLALEAAFKATLKDMRGAYAIVGISTLAPDTLFAAKLSSPMVLGVGDNEMVIASDPLAIVPHTKKVIFIEDGQVLIVQKNIYKIEDLAQEKAVTPKIELLEHTAELTTKGDFPHFMLKEIYEAPQTIKLAIAGRVHSELGLVKLGGLERVTEQLHHIDRLVIVACGTASYAGMLGEYFMEELAGIPTEVQLASEFIYRTEPLSRSTAVLAVSQSGETADTISALKKVENYGCLRLGVVNTVGSAVTRMTDAGVYCHAGPEQAVASTKAFIAQVTVLLLIALYINNGKSEQFKPLLHELESLPEKAAAVLAQAPHIEQLAQKYAGYRDFLFIGRRYAYPCALEGALKLKECSYIHAEGYAAGEMKHGPLALIDSNFPTFALAGNSSLLEKTYSNIQEIRARKGPIVAIADEGNTAITQLADDVIYIPKTLEQTQPILMAIVMQLFAYYVAVAKNLDVDRPRNLAKSVTTE
jgi:glucosamine--fructose-6-phosphate aminotransferase (isomerizing)